MKVSFITLGCRVNQYESQALSECLASLSFEEVPFGEETEVCIVNTCAVTGESARKSRQMIGRALRIKEKNSAALVCAVGCYTQGCAGKIDSDPLLSRLDIIGGNPGKVELWKEIARLAQKEPQERERIVFLQDTKHWDTYEKMSITKSKNARAFVKIEDGCNSFCSYCYVPIVRGRVRSRPYEDIKSEVRELVQNGFSEIVLTGIETGAYGKGLNESVTLEGLVERLHETEGLSRIRLGSLKPTVITEEFCRRLSSLPKVMPHFHLSLQSGSDRILSAMRRRYGREEEEAAIQRIRKYFPDAGLSADLICGFPGETEEDFEDTLSLCRKAQLLHTHIFPFSPRESTPAAAMENQISPDVKKRRCARLLEVARRESAAFAAERVGREYHILCEKCRDGKMYGYTENFIYTAAPCEGEAQIGGIYRAELGKKHSFSVETMTVEAKLLDNFPIKL